MAKLAASSSAMGRSLDLDLERNLDRDLGRNLDLDLELDRERNLVRDLDQELELDRGRDLVQDLEQKIGTELGGSGSGRWIIGPVSNTVQKRVDRTSFLGK